MESYYKRADRYGIVYSYCYDIFNGKKGCSEELMLKIKKDYPEMEFVLLHPRWILKKPNEELSFIENKVEELQQRLDKAIEYIKILREKYFRECVAGSSEDLNEIIHILEIKDE